MKHSGIFLGIGPMDIKDQFGILELLQFQFCATDLLRFPIRLGKVSSGQFNSFQCLGSVLPGLRVKAPTLGILEWDPRSPVPRGDPANLQPDKGHCGPWFSLTIWVYIKRPPDPVCLGRPQQAQLPLTTTLMESIGHTNLFNSIRWWLRRASGHLLGSCFMSNHQRPKLWDSLDIPERFSLSTDLGRPWFPPQRARGGGQGEGGLVKEVRQVEVNGWMFLL